MRVRAEHLAGDGQADLRVHSGRDKAGYAYPREHWAYWQHRLPAAQLVPGAFGGNVTTIGLMESEVRVGDCFQVGTAVLRTIQPRRPCVKLGILLARLAADVTFYVPAIISYELSKKRLRRF
ncbi:hypothetical protein GCM10022408_23880 [Hymenobacter fastidiosus]|uniref:MOSC domain-containing protein n=1 Tax=Hymenobacter fastidiosus TaxID=486264 RepID=A0ABP7SF67_9BACT